MLHHAVRPLLRLMILSLLLGFLPPAPAFFNTATIAHAAPVAVAAAQSNGSFPTTAVLDSFNRANGVVGSAWSGDTSSFAIASQQLTLSGNGLLYWTTSFGANQEAYVTLPAIGAGANEIDLLLKGQDAGGCNLLEIWYQPSRGTAQVWTCDATNGWQQHGSVSVRFQAGDQSTHEHANQHADAH